MLRSNLAEVRQRLIRSNGALVSRGIARCWVRFSSNKFSVCSQMEGGTWQESLAEALDYRKWHRFGVERYQDGVWKTADAPNARHRFRRRKSRCAHAAAFRGSRRISIEPRIRSRRG